MVSLALQRRRADHLAFEQREQHLAAVRQDLVLRISEDALVDRLDAKVALQPSDIQAAELSAQRRIERDDLQAIVECGDDERRLAGARTSRCVLVEYIHRRLLTSSGWRRHSALILAGGTVTVQPMRGRACKPQAARRSAAGQWIRRLPARAAPSAHSDPGRPAGRS